MMIIITATTPTTNEKMLMIVAIKVLTLLVASPPLQALASGAPTVSEDPVHRLPWISAAAKAAGAAATGKTSATIAEALINNFLILFIGIFLMILFYLSYTITVKQ